jgi:hypothetical protein
MEQFMEAVLDDSTAVEPDVFCNSLLFFLNLAVGNCEYHASEQSRARLIWKKVTLNRSGRLVSRDLDDVVLGVEGCSDGVVSSERCNAKLGG